MKLAKKVLSVVLAVAIALGAFAVAASANGNPDTARYQIKLWLAGTTGTLDWTGNSRVKITENSDPEMGTIEANPGDTVFVYLYATNNYYTQLFQTNVFHSAELLDAQQIYFADENVTSTSFGTTAVKKVYLWNSNNTWISCVGTNASAQTPWEGIASAARYNIAENWPTSDADNTTSLIDTTKYHWTRITNVVSDQYTDTTSYLEDDGEHLIKFPLTIPADAEPGTTYSVFIPEGIERRDAKPAGMLFVNENGIADGESEPTDYVDTQAATNPNMRYDNENQYFDFSEATLTIQIPGESTPTIDYAELEAKLTEAGNLLAAGNLTKTSVATLNAAIEVGNSALTSEDQDTVDAAVDTLTDAIAAAKTLADFAALNEALSEYADLTAADWTDASWADVAAAYEVAAAIDQEEESDQDKVDAAANDLATAIDNLVAALVYTDLEAKYNEVKDTDTSIYTDETAGAFNSALAVAENLVTNKNAADQNEINTALANLTSTHGALTEKDADYDKLTAAKDAFLALDEKAWTTDSYAAAKAAYEAACAVAEGLKISQQSVIDAAADELNAKIGALVPAGSASYTALEDAITAAKALVEEHYTTDSWAAIATALEAAEKVDRNLTANDQAIVDKATEALVNAMNAKVEADADYSAVELAKAAAAAKVAENDEGTLRYTDDSIDAINGAVAAVVEGLKKKDQAVVDGYATAINNAIGAAEYRPYDYTDIQAKIDEFNGLNRDDYKHDTYDAVADAIAGLNMNYTHEQYAAAKVQEYNFNTTYAALTAADAADYDDVNLAIDEFEEKIAAADYEQAGIDAVNAIIDAIDWDLNENKQDVVDEYAAAIREATDALVEVVVEYADYSRIDAALETIEGLNKDEYTTTSWAAIDAALELVEGLAKDLIKEQQSEVDAVADALEAAIAGLKKLANLDELKAAIVEGDGYDPNVWTEETYSVLAKAVAEGRALMEKELSEDDQEAVDKATENIKDAISKMVRKPVLSSISAINWTPSEDTHNTFDVVVNGRMAMIQFIEVDGGTRTYDRYNKNVTIVSYNAAGEEVNSLSRDVAYEIWTINTNLIGPEVKARAKYLEGNSYTWEAETYNFTVEVLEPVIDAEIRSITPAATAGKKGAVATTVVVGPDAQGIRFVMDNGTTTTYYADKATVLENGDLEFTGNAWANNDGLNTIIVKVRVNNAWVEAGTVEYTVE